MTSETQMAYESGLSRHGRNRAWLVYQLSKRVENGLLSSAISPVSWLKHAAGWVSAIKDEPKDGSTQDNERGIHPGEGQQYKCCGYKEQFVPPLSQSRTPTQLLGAKDSG